MRYGDLPLATLEAYLEEARAALHALMIGDAAVSVGTAGGRRVEFAAARANDLRGYISELEAAVASASSGAAGRGPIRVVLG